MLRLVETEQSLEIQDQMPALKRVLLLLLSLIPLLALYQLIILPDWNDYLNLYFLFVVIISLGALAVSGFLVWAAIAGLNSILRFNRQQKTFTYIADAPVVPFRKFEYPIGSIQALNIETHDWSEGSPSYSLKIVMNDERAFKSGSSWSRAEIEEIRKRAGSFLNLSYSE